MKANGLKLASFNVIRVSWTRAQHKKSIRMSGGDWKQMFKAVQEGDEALVEFYLRSGIDPNYQHPEYMAAALVESIRFNHLNITKLLLENNADPTIKEVWAGDTPMSVATDKKNQRAIALLEEYMRSGPDELTRNDSK